MVSRKAIGLVWVLSGAIAIESPAQGFEAAAPMVAQSIQAQKPEGVGQTLEAANRLSELGIQQYQAKDYPAALQSLETALVIYRTLENRPGEATVLLNLGVTYRALSQSEKAIDHYTQALPIFQALNDSAGQADTLLKLGSAFRSLAQYQKAVNYYTQALPIFQALNDRAGQADTLLNLGSVYRSLSQYQPAIDQYTQALPIFQALENRKGEANTLNSLGITYGSLAQYEKAIGYYTQALPIFQAVQDRQGEAKALTNLAIAYQSLSRYEKVIEYHTQALSIYQAMPDRQGEATALMDLATAYQSLSQYEKAIKYHTQALSIYQAIPDRNGAAKALMNLADVYRSLSQYQKAIGYYNQALDLQQSVNDPNEKARALMTLGRAFLSLSQPQKAIEYHTQALSIYQAIQDRHSEATALANLGGAYAALVKYDPAISHYTQALPIFQAVQDRHGEATVLNNLGLAYAALAKYDQAISHYTQALPIFHTIQDREGEGKLFNNLGVLFTKQDEPELAIVFYKQSVNVRENIRIDIRNLPRDSQEAYTQSVAGTYRALADLLLKQDRILEAQQVLDLLKLQEFSDSLRDTRSAPQRLAFHKAEQQLLEKFNQQQQGAIAAAQDLKTLLDRPETQRSPQDRDRIRQLQQLQEAIATDFIQFIASAEVKTLTEQLRRKDSGSLDPEFLNQIQNKLGNQLAKLPHTALFYPLILDDRLELILVTPDSAPIRRTVPIKREDLNRAISSFSSALKDSSQDAKPSAQALYNILIQPIADDLKNANITTLLYSPDRRLRYVPLPALHDGKQWLLERFTINYITVASVTDLTTPRQPQPQVLAGAISDSRQQRYTVNLPQAQRQFLGLPNVSQELNGIAAQLPNARLLRDRDFTVDAIKALFRQYNILHFATHGSFERDRPELSFILFGDNGSDGKNYATLQDIATWKLDADLVILSACETGLADDQFTAKADDSVAVMGLGYRFEQAGARATIASLWTVNDASTSVMMQQFYANLIGGKTTKSEALRQAQLALLNNKVQPKTKDDRGVVQPTAPNQPTRNDRFSPGYTHPYYWAPFILIGNGL